MTQNDYIFIVESLFEISDIELRVDRATINQALNESLQKLWIAGVAADESAYTKTASIAGTDLAHPTGFMRLLLVEVPASAAGAAQKIGHRQWQTVQNNPVLASTSDYPGYREDATVIHVAPSSSCVVYYITSIPEITDWTIDLMAYPVAGSGPQAVLLWPFEEAYIMGGIYVLTQREMGKPGVPESEVKKMFDLSEQAKQVFDASKTQFAIFQQSSVMPKLPVQENNG